MSDSGWQSISRRWLNCETFMVCVDDVALVRKVNVRRIRPGCSEMIEETVPGLEIVCGGKITEIDYLEEEHRDQVYDAIWAALKGDAK